MGVVYFSIIPTFEPSRYCKCWIVCFYNMLFLRNCDGLNVSDKSFKVLKFDNNKITLEEEL